MGNPARHLVERREDGNLILDHLGMKALGRQ